VFLIRNLFTGIFILPVFAVDSVPVKIAAFDLKLRTVWTLNCERVLLSHVSIRLMDDRTLHLFVVTEFGSWVCADVNIFREGNLITYYYVISWNWVVVHCAYPPLRQLSHSLWWREYDNG